MSTHYMASNQLRLWFSTLAYLLVERLQALTLQGTDLAQCDGRNDPEKSAQSGGLGQSECAASLCATKQCVSVAEVLAVEQPAIGAAQLG